MTALEWALNTFNNQNVQPQGPVDRRQELYGLAPKPAGGGFPILGGFWDALINPLIGNTYQSTKPATKEEWNQVVDAAIDAGLTDDQIGRIYTMSMANGAPLWSMIQEVANYEAENADTAKQDEIKAQEAEYLRVAQGENEKAITRSEGNLARYTNMVENPAAIRQDAEYGQALANAENIANAQAEATKRQAGYATAQSGLRSSGRAADQTLRAQEAASAQKIAALGNLFTGEGGINSRRDAIQGYLDQLGVQKGELLAGRIPLSFDLAKLSSGGPVFSPLENAQSVLLGGEAASRGAAQQGWGTAFGKAQNDQNSIMNMFSSLPFGKS